MKNIFYILSILIVFSCTKKEILESDSRNCQEAAYDSEFEVQLSDEVCFPDGNTLIINRIEHQFCPCEVVCVWEGDLFLSFTNTADNVTKEKEFYPSRLNIDRSIFDNHEISSLSYRYASEDGTVPACMEDFEAEKITLTLTISQL